MASQVWNMASQVRNVRSQTWNMCSHIWNLFLVLLEFNLAKKITARFFSSPDFKIATNYNTDGMGNCLQQPGQLPYGDLKATLRKLSVIYRPERSLFF